ncbi:hypothetical protein K3G63_16270 [Hymenobacter sp. HSC-4F20]|uniref:hypothetical protein n=1 Tax=Hymenobacter sp. HSC-4F20 TaxID=2864135 RepID=UPI001C73918F|nr:hypothetical protein [Hymenobacter sp. HSC-4F20]MBX0292008.1 hypothetical protein [Hymenobacter sp. HSC-4F20]
MSSAADQAPLGLTLDQASDWTRRYREQHTDQIKGHHFSRATLEAILAQPECAGIRLYYGRDEHNQRRLILVGTDSNDFDLLGTATALQAPTSDEPAAASFAAAAPTPVEAGTPCPPCCSVTNSLNS